MNKLNTKNSFMKNTSYLESKFIKRLIFNPSCFINLKELFNLTLPKDFRGVDDYPFRDLIQGVANSLDVKRKYDEALRYQLTFFLFVILFHSIGDTDYIFQKNRNVKLQAILQYPKKVGKKVQIEMEEIQFGTQAYVLTDRLLLLAQRYDFRPRELGKRMGDFMAHSLHNMDVKHKRPSQYSDKLTNEYFIPLKRVKLEYG